jgi:hypothetical protein
MVNIHTLGAPILEWAAQARGGNVVILGVDQGNEIGDVIQALSKLVVFFLEFRTTGKDFKNSFMLGQ